MISGSSDDSASQTVTPQMMEPQGKGLPWKPLSTQQYRGTFIKDLGVFFLIVKSYVNLFQRRYQHQWTLRYLGQTVTMETTDCIKGTGQAFYDSSLPIGLLKNSLKARFSGLRKAHFGRSCLRLTKANGWNEQTWQLVETYSTNISYHKLGLPLSQAYFLRFLHPWYPESVESNKCYIHPLF